MPYSAFPDRAIPYHLDGTVIKHINITTGVIDTLSAGNLAELNDFDYTKVTLTQASVADYMVVFFPELRDITAIFGTHWITNNTVDAIQALTGLEGSADTTNGIDGTWSAATVAAYPPAVNDLDSWRKSIKAVSGLDGVKAIRFTWVIGTFRLWKGMYALHLYGKKTAGQTVDDILFLDAEDGDAEFAIPQDFGDRPAGTSVQHQIKIKNASTTLTASTVTLTVYDANDLIRISDSSSGPWETSMVIASLAANTKSDVIYIKCETPAAPTPLGPQKPLIGVTVGSWV
jgi:hypothetical protein